MISAIFEQDFNLDTISWNLGPEISYIEFNIADQVTSDKIAAAEKKCNALIAQAIPVRVQILNAETTDLTSPEVCLARSFVTKVFFVWVIIENFLLIS